MEFADDQIEELLERTAKGETLTKVTSDPRMPARATVYTWIDEGGPNYDAEFAGRFRDARAQGIHALAEECIEIADEAPKDAVHVADKRVRIDTRLRLAGKWMPKAYGEKIQHADADGEKLPTSVSITFVKPPES